MTDSSVRPLVLRENQLSVKCAAGMGVNIDFPAGTYSPNFQSDEGVYYRANGNLIQHTLLGDFVKRGGVFIPHRTAKDQRQGVWFDNQDQADAITFSATSPKRVFRLKAPIQFESAQADKAGAQ